MTKLLEKDMQRSIKDFLQLKGYLVIKFNNVGIYKKNTDSYIPPSQKGIADLICCSPNGRFVAIEVKVPGNKPSVYQTIFADQVNKSKGFAITAYSLDDVMNFIEGNKVFL